MENNQEKKPETVVEVIEGGPLKITGNIFFQDIKRDISVNVPELYLCRCGHSCNKPFCDDSHKK
jgi:CDGSH-type Zn-finger protein